MNQKYPQKSQHLTGGHCRLISFCNKKYPKFTIHSDDFQKCSLFLRYGRIS